MNYSRAKEILNSENTIEVLYNNTPIWINNLNPDNNMASITDTDKNNIEVSVEELEEGKTLE